MAEITLLLLLPKRDRGPILGDLAEEFTRLAEADGVRFARRWYWQQFIRAIVPAARRRLDTKGRGEARFNVTKLGFSWLDVKIGLRMLGKHPGLSLVAVFALAVGIPVGLAPTHFVNAHEAPPPVDESDRLQVLRSIDLVNSVVRPGSLYDFNLWREELTSFEALGASMDAVYNVISEDGRAAPVEGAEVTASMFGLLRVAPLQGRTLIAADEAVGAPPVVVIGHDVWQSRLGGDPDVVGRVIQIGGVERTVVGVMPKEFLYPWLDQVWVPLRARALTDDHGQKRRLRVFGRLLDGVSPEEAEVELSTLGRRMSVDLPQTHAKLRLQVVPFTLGVHRLPRGGWRALPGFYFVQVLTVLMLAFPCANIGMLILARTANRSSELAVRTALGASRARIILQLFTESLVLAVLAAGVGLVIADRFVSRVGTVGWVHFGVTPQTALLALTLAVFSAAVAGVVPALKVTSGDVHRNLQHAVAGRAGIRFGGMSSALIVADVALAVAIIGASVGVWGIDRSAGMGIETDQFLSAELRIPRIDPEGDGSAISRSESVRLAAAQDALVQRLAGEPGVGGVAVASVLPGMDHPVQRIEVEGESDRRLVRHASVDVGFFDALQQPILSGRGFGPDDLGENSSSVIVNTNFAGQVLGGRNPLGIRVRQWSRAQDGPWYEIVGVVGSLGMLATATDADAGIYYPLAPGQIHPVPFAIRVGDDPAAFAPRLRELAGEADPAAVISAPVALSEVLSQQVLLLGWLRSYFLVVIGILLTISTMAIYALMSFTVAQRTREIGIRIALGARWRAVVATIARRAMVQLGLGALAGMTVAGLLLALLENVAGKIPMGSPVLVASMVTVGVVVLIGALACIAPTLRALRIAPTDALREGI